MMNDYKYIFKSLTSLQFLILAIGGCLIGIHFNLVLQYGSTETLILHCLFLLTAIFLIWEKRQSLNLGSGVFSTISGLLIILLLLINNSLDFNSAGLLFLSPLMSGLSLALLASGFKGLKQYIPELLGAFFLSAQHVIYLFLDISLLTAKFSYAILWYTGFKVTRSGVNINFPTGGIEVYSGCSGMGLILNLLGLAILFILIFNIDLLQKIKLFITAVAAGFITNSLRVYLMGILIANGHNEAFKYWHEGDGSLIFSFIGSVIFGCYCWFLLISIERENKNLAEGER